MGINSPRLVFESITTPTLLALLPGRRNVLPPRTTMLKQLFLVLALTAHALCDEEVECADYTDFMKPLIETNDIDSLREAFKLMNTERNVVTPYAMYAVESSVIVDTHYMKMLLSLSKPMLAKMNSHDVWPENYNLPTPFIGKVCEKDINGELQCMDASSFHAVLNPMNTFHGGIRYVYNCQTLQTKSCLKKKCKYNPETPIIKTEKGGEIYVPIENFIAADGSAMADHVTEEDDAFVIEGFSRLVVRDCFARQLFFVPTEDSCFRSSMFFSLSEAVSMGGHHRKSDRDAHYDFMKPRRAYFVVMQM